MAQALKMAYQYSAGFASLGIGATAQDNIQIESSANFVITKTMIFANENGTPATNVANLPIPNILVQLVDSASSERLTRNAVPASALFGTAQLPYIWPEGRLIRANSTLEVTVQNLSGVQYDNLYLVFGGYRMFLQGQ